MDNCINLHLCNRRCEVFIINHHFAKLLDWKSGEPVGIRTRDLLIKSQLLYQLSYRPTKARIRMLTREGQVLFFLISDVSGMIVSVGLYHPHEKNTFILKRTTVFENAWAW